MNTTKHISIGTLIDYLTLKSITEDIDKGASILHYLKKYKELSEKFLKPDNEISKPFYRPYTSAEFQQRWKLGEVITIRKKSEPLNVYDCLITEYSQIMTHDMKEPEHYVKMGSYNVSLEELFNDFEYCEESEWLPFGVNK